MFALDTNRLYCRAQDLYYLRVVAGLGKQDHTFQVGQHRRGSRLRIQGRNLTIFHRLLQGLVKTRVGLCKNGIQLKSFSRSGKKKRIMGRVQEPRGTFTANGCSNPVIDARIN